MARGVPKNGINRGWFQRGVAQIRTDAHKKAIGEGQRRAWRGGRKRAPIGATWIDKQGYVRVKVAEPCNYWRPEHLIVAEQKLGRPLLPGEVVHHVNVTPSDNSPDNLHVCADKSRHNAVHRSFLDLVKGLLTDGLIRFNAESEKYERCR